MPAQSFPSDWPEWVPKPDALQETRKPFRRVGAQYLTALHMGDYWLKRNPDVNVSAFKDAWIRYLARQLKATKAPPKKTKAPKAKPTTPTRPKLKRKLRSARRNAP